MEDFLPFATPDIGEEEIAEVVDTLRSPWITTGPKTALFEREFAGYVGADYALAVSSGTAGLHLALEASGVSEGDLVITTPYTFTATAEVVRYLGADPAFVDVDAGTMLIDPAQVEHFCAELCHYDGESLVHSESGRVVSAIMPVHVGGLPCDMETLERIASAYGLAVIEDAAHALPTDYGGTRVGSGPGLAAFSFYATKPLTTGEGGMVTTGNVDQLNRMKMMRLHGMTRDVWDRYQATTPKWYYEVAAPGFKYNMSDIAASIGIHQLKKADLFHRKRSYIARRYHEAFADVEAIARPTETANASHSWHLYIIQIEDPAIDRGRFIEEMAAEGIGTSVHFIPLHIQPYYRDRYGFREDDFPNALAAYRKAVSLPIYTRMSDTDIERVTEAVKVVLHRLSR